MINTDLLAAVSTKSFLKLGFREAEYSKYGIIYRLKNERFTLTILPTFEVTLSHNNPETEPMTIMVRDFGELEKAVNWIKF